MIPQIKPARAKKKVNASTINDSFIGMYTDQKIDGERFLLHSHITHDVRCDYMHGITSRVVSTVTGRYTEKMDRVPHLANHPELDDGMILDNEFVSSGDIVLVDLPGKFWDKLLEPHHSHMIWLKSKFDGALPVYPHVRYTTSILGSLGPEAVRKQAERGLIWAYCFDILQYNFQDLRAITQESRRITLRNVLENVDPEKGLILMPTWANLTVDEILELFALITDAPVYGEGLILKDPFQPYNGPQNWYKFKKEFPVDVVLTGQCKIGGQGKTGQMLGKAASLEIGVYQDGVLIPIGWVSGIMDGMHNLVDADRAEEAFKGKVIECYHNGVQEDPTSPLGISLRHPRFKRWRRDKSSIDCTLSRLIADAA